MQVNKQKENKKRKQKSLVNELNYYIL